jgi:hypothetical protein
MYSYTIDRWALTPRESWKQLAASIQTVVVRGGAGLEPNLDLDVKVRMRIITLSTTILLLVPSASCQVDISVLFAPLRTISDKRRLGGILEPDD